MKIVSQTLPRTLLAAALAFAGTFVGFSMTLAPAHAASAGYTAKLAAPLAAPASKVVNGVVWKCNADSCSGPVDGARPVNTCTKVAKTFGQVSQFATPKGEFSAEDLQRCNAAA